MNTSAEVRGLVKAEIADSTGGRLRVLELFAPRRVLVPDLRPLSRRRRCGSGVRYAVRARKLTPAQESAIRALAETKSMRSLAADFGVSHETNRAPVSLSYPASIRQHINIEELVEVG